jgi:hypothetical protein
MKRRKTFSLNLHRNYVPNWGIAEVVREVVSNARDAGAHTVEFFGDDRVVVSNEGDPGLFELLVIGGGTKTEGGETIGQFGEGLKMAALVATRTRGSHMSISCPKGRLSFEFKKNESLGGELLTAVLDESSRSDNFTVIVDGKNVKEIYDTMFLQTDSGYGPIERQEQSKMRVFAKGVHITTLEEPCLFDWNLEHLKLNRDRTIPDTYAIRSGVGSFITSQLWLGSEEWADRLLEHQNSYEAQSLRSTWLGDKGKKMMTGAFYRKYGENAVLASSDTSRNQLAAARGYKPIVLPDHIATELTAKSVDDVITVADRLIPSDITIGDAMMAELNYVVDRLNIPCLIQICKDDGEHMGFAQIQGGMVNVWLNETLFMPGKRKDRLRTLCHELGHIQGGTDGDLKFEHSLDGIAGELAGALLDSRHAN